MRAQGILRTWHDDRGFGFIAPTQGGAELFVHISAFPRDGSRPLQGETLSYELARGADGRVQAAKVMRLAVGASAQPRRQRRAARTGGVDVRRLLGGLLVLVLLLVSGQWAWQRYRQVSHRMDLERLSPTTAPIPPGTTPVASPYRCDGRTHCSQMTSCAEATWFINHCPGTQMDGNHDGVPCEQQWCTGR